MYTWRVFVVEFKRAYATIMKPASVLACTALHNFVSIRHGCILIVLARVCTLKSLWLIFNASIAAVAFS